MGVLWLKAVASPPSPPSPPPPPPPPPFSKIGLIVAGVVPAVLALLL